MSDDCIFCKIASGQIPVKAVFEDEQIIAFPDINPAAPVHVLIIPKKHIPNILEFTPDDVPLAAHVMTNVIPRIAKILGVAEDGFRVVINTRDNGGQTVHHLHWHILGGRFMNWPPG